MLSKLIYICFLLTIISGYSLAQDTLHFTNGTTKTVVVEEINEKNIIYKPFNFIDGPRYIENKNTIRKIVYKNGMTDVFIQKDIPPTSSEILVDDAPYYDPHARHHNNFVANNYKTQPYSAFSFNSMSLLNLSVGLQYEHRFENSPIVLWLPGVIGLNPAKRLTTALPLTQTKKNYSIGIGIKYMIFDEDHKNGVFIAPLVEYANLYYVNRMTSWKKTYTNGEAFIFSINGGKNLLLTPHMYGSIYAGVGIRSQSTYKTTIYPVVKGGLCFGVLF